MADLALVENELNKVEGRYVATNLIAFGNYVGSHPALPKGVPA